MSLHLVQSDMTRGFGAALMIPAAASTLRQALRESADSLRVLARHHQAGTPMDARTRAAARLFGRVLLEQGINGMTFFLAVKCGLALAGPFGGMIAQVGITANTIVTPQQTQHVNPARSLFEALGIEPDWVERLPEPMVERFASVGGAFADSCGYGAPAPAGAPPRGIRVQFLPGVPSMGLRGLRRGLA